MSINGVRKIQNDFQNGNYYTNFSFNDITLGYNGDYNASQGWDPVTGLGSFIPSIQINSGTKIALHAHFLIVIFFFA